MIASGLSWTIDNDGYFKGPDDEMLISDLGLMGGFRGDGKGREILENDNEEENEAQKEKIEAYFKAAHVKA